ncbi:EAL domain-containing protein (putative c-di-GMP-specific phosphodiesterase class I) [Herbinix hemicellulosilytica]|uniref:EAL domain-containing protein n=1 Tax=Herbinix hemicellulosilytica TaxID=1564487 RepID=A0A0H5SGA4_HERHM|nr:EAL domain-containing protein [Herbinix hemicellulosilytica]RBP56470.1 EAL domain-containing protein (putative c-di-GMP-specific phosphodiesterase class I) [Herbinix hemicellulosilytica]CRZ34050.1 hypothetical protein HHT355_0847 [Herbinix hemicellulosilytica]
MHSIFGRSDKSIRMNLIKMFVICLMIVAVLQTVYLTGGTKKAFVQLMFIPIILSSLFWGAYAGLAVGIIGGIFAGTIPLDVSQDIMQDPINWISRSIIFSIIGFTTGYLFDKINRLNAEKQERNLKSPFYNLPNAQQLFYDLENRIKAGEHFRLVSIKLTNLYEIEKYIDNKLTFDIVENLAKKLEHSCGRKAVYSYEKDELIVLICDFCLNEYEEKLKRILDNYVSSPIKMNGYKFRVSIKVGIYLYKGEETTPIEIYNKARIAYEQGEPNKSGVYYYDRNFEKKRRENQDITGALLESIIKNEMYVVYQPKIDIVNNKISGVEALVRWKRNGTDYIEPNIFITIAEEIGFINKISEFVFKSVTKQIMEWKSKGIKVKCSVNVSVYDLLDEYYTYWVNGIFSDEDIDRSDFEIEITERVIAYNDKKLLDKMYYFKEKGFLISIDDFGTGYNSLMSIGEIPFDKLKIDKYFISRLNRIEVAELVKSIIQYAHTFGKIVVAEGVENEEQIKILKSFNCDEVQGYYFSKPLMPEEFEEFYSKFNKLS